MVARHWAGLGVLLGFWAVAGLIITLVAFMVVGFLDVCDRRQPAFKNVTDGSGRVIGFYSTTRVSTVVNLGRGQVVYRWADSSERPRWAALPAPGEAVTTEAMGWPLRWLLLRHTYRNGIRISSLYSLDPLGLIANGVMFAACAFGFAAAWRWVGRYRRQRRSRLGLCAGCGYDLAGCPGGPCPECGLDPGSVGEGPTPARRQASLFVS